MRNCRFHPRHVDVFFEPAAHGPQTLLITGSALNGLGCLFSEDLDVTYHRPSETPVPAPSGAFKAEARVGQYGESRCEFDIAEEGGQLWAVLGRAGRCRLSEIADGFYALVLPDSGESLRLRFGGDRNLWLEVNGRRLPRRDFGREALENFQRVMAARSGMTPTLPLRATCPAALRAGRRKSDLVPVEGMACDIRYATENNFVGFPVYDYPGAFVQRPVLDALRKVDAGLAQQGYGLVILDAYRPWAVTHYFWEIVPTEFRAFLSDPEVGSNHNRGASVDVTLLARATGRQIEMITPHDEATERAAADYPGGTSHLRALRDLLRQAMERSGFTGHPLEWWHFDYEGAGDYPVEDASLRELAGQTPGLE